MYYTGIHPMTKKEVYVTTDYREKQLQRALLQFTRPENANLVREALKLAGREDLIGFDKDCLVKPDYRAVKGKFDPTRKSEDRLRQKERKPKSEGKLAGRGKNPVGDKKSAKNTKNGAKPRSNQYISTKNAKFDTKDAKKSKRTRSAVKKQRGGR